MIQAHNKHEKLMHWHQSILQMTKTESLAQTKLHQMCSYFLSQKSIKSVAEINLEAANFSLISDLQRKNTKRDGRSRWPIASPTMKQKQTTLAMMSLRRATLSATSSLLIRTWQWSPACEKQLPLSKKNSSKWHPMSQNLIYAND